LKPHKKGFSKFQRTEIMNTKFDFIKNCSENRQKTLICPKIAFY